MFERGGEFVKAKLVSFDFNGFPQFGSDVTLPGSGIATGDITAIATGPTEVRVYAPTGQGSTARLREWQYLNGAWSDLGNQQWSDGSFIVPTFGVGVTRGYQDGSATPSTYGAIPTSPDSLVEFARKDNVSPYRWSKVTLTCPSSCGSGDIRCFGCSGGVASSWVGTGGAGLSPGGTQPRAAARPGLAYQKRAGQPNNFVGRFYMAINQGAQCSGPFGTPSGTPAGCNSVLIMTEGNVASGMPSTKRLTWITPAQWLASPFAIGGITLMDDPDPRREPTGGVRGRERIGFFPTVR